MQMWLSRLMPTSKPGQELRVFECPVCERTEYTTVELENYRHPIALALLGHGL
jgi:hypothetical protein